MRWFPRIIFRRRPKGESLTVTVGGPNTPVEPPETGMHPFKTSDHFVPVHGVSTRVSVYGGVGAGGAGATSEVHVWHGWEDGVAKGYLCPDDDCPLCVHGMGGAHPTDADGRRLHYHQFAASQGIEP